MPADILCLSHLRWGFVYQRPNHLMARFARGRRVFFVEEPIFDSDAPHLELSVVENGLHVAVPHLPHGTAPEAAELLQRVLLDDLIEKQNVKAPVVWFYTPMALGYARGLDASAVVYDCMDELSHFHGAPPALLERERELFALADVVFTGGQSLYEAKRAHHPNCHAFPSSVDAIHFGRARGKLEDPGDQRAIAHPRVGFFGVIDERMDLDLLGAVAKARPDLQLVVLGPVVKISPDRLPRLPNLHYLGGKKYDELPQYIAGWDVAMMPFARNDATKFISPTKTLEYLAAGKPVVSTSIRDVVQPYNDLGLARIADEPTSFIAAIDASLEERGTPEESRIHAVREAFLAKTSWDGTWQRMNALLDEAITHKSRASVARRPERPTAAGVASVARHERHEEEIPCSTI